MSRECQKLYLFIYQRPEEKWKKFCCSVCSSHPSRFVWPRAGNKCVILFCAMMSASIVISDFPSRRATLVPLFSEIGDLTNTEVTTNYANRVQLEDKPPNAVTVWDELLSLGKMLAEAQGLETQHRSQLLRRDQESHGNHGECCISYLSDPCEQNCFLYFSETAKPHAHPLTKPTAPSPTPRPTQEVWDGKFHGDRILPIFITPFEPCRPAWDLNVDNSTSPLSASDTRSVNNFSHFIVSYAHTHPCAC